MRCRPRSTRWKAAWTPRPRRSSRPRPRSRPRRRRSSRADSGAGRPDSGRRVERAGGDPSAAAAEIGRRSDASLKDGHLGVATEDKRFSLNLYGLVQLDTGAYFQDAPGPITTDLRRSGPALGYSSSNVDFATRGT